METRRTTKRASIAEPQESNDLLWAVGLGTSFDTPDRHGLTPLMIACRDNKLDVVQYLVDRGSNINAVDERGFSPIFYSVREGNHRMPLFPPFHISSDHRVFAGSGRQLSGHPQRRVQPADVRRHER